MKYVRPVSHEIIPYKHFTKRDVSEASPIFHNVFLEILGGDWSAAYFVPQEVVLQYPGQLVVPRVARSWYVDQAHAIFFSLPKLEPVRIDHPYGPWMFSPSFHLVEHFEDSGDDGHTDYRPAGWLIVDSNQLELMSGEHAEMSYTLDYVSLPNYQSRTKVQADLQPEVPEVPAAPAVPRVKRVRRAFVASHDGDSVPVDGSFYHPDDDFPSVNFDDLSPSPPSPAWVRSPDLDDDIAESLGGGPEITGDLIVDGPTIFGVDLSTGGPITGRMYAGCGNEGTEIKRPVVTGHSVSGQYWPSPAGAFRIDTVLDGPDGSMTVQVSSDDPKVDLRKHAESIAQWALTQVPDEKSGSFEIKVTGPLPSETRLIDSGDDL